MHDGEWIETDEWGRIIALWPAHSPAPAPAPKPLPQLVTPPAQVARAKRPYCEMDTECDFHWWLIKFYLPDGRMFSYDIDAESGRQLDTTAIQWFIDNYTLVSFNGENYDIPMLAYAMSGVSVHALKRLNDQIIVGGLKRWDFWRAYPQVPELANLDHVDIMEVAPGVRLGLKTYMGRMHSRTLWDLPFDPSAPMPIHMRPVTDEYCGNDLIGTRELRETCGERLALREEYGALYGVDLRSKSDAQMAEAIIKARLSFRPEKRIVPHGCTFRYEPAPWLQFTTPLMQQVYATVCNALFVVNDVDQVREATGLTEILLPDGKKMKTGVLMPEELKTLKVPIGGSVYQFGIGGLHSTEQSAVHHTTPGVQMISDHDVKSYYPSMILLLRMFPAQIGEAFLEIYREIYDDRIKASNDVPKIEALIKEKRAALAAARCADLDGLDALRSQMVTKAGGAKIVLNGTFGKLFSKYSILFAPELGIRVTITGQLSLLMLIESLELVGVSVVSANTDGIVLRTPHGREWLRNQCIAAWEARTGLKMEATFYKAIYQRDVNNYVAIKLDGKHKGKGAFAESGVLNNVHPGVDVCLDAVIAYLKKGAPLEETIRACQDVRKFLMIRNAKGGGYDKTGRYLGKTVRWYYSAGETEGLYYKEKINKKTGQLVRGNIIAESNGARECMTLPDTLPGDIDYPRYVAYAQKMLATLGVINV